MQHSVFIIFCVVTKARLSSLRLLLWYSVNDNFQSLHMMTLTFVQNCQHVFSLVLVERSNFFLNNHCTSNVVALIALIVTFPTHTANFRLPRNVWRYQRGNQKLLFIEQDMQWQNKKSQTDIDYIQLKANDCTKRTQLITRVNSVVPEV